MLRAGRFVITTVAVLSVLPLVAQKSPTDPWSVRMAKAVEQRYPDGKVGDQGPKGMKWNYNLGTLLQGMEGVWQTTADPQFYNYIRSNVDSAVSEDGTIAGFDPKKASLDDYLMGRQALFLYRTTLKEKYWKAATSIYRALEQQPRTPEGGFWHRSTYPNQMWLDGIYMAEPFYAEYSTVTGATKNYADITNQFKLIDDHLHDPKSGLLLHVWDESKKQRWADKTTGASPNVWARSVGWYMMALVETIEILPENDPSRTTLIAILIRNAEPLLRAQDKRTGLWWQLPALPAAEGNYYESSANCMFAYSFLKASRLGLLPVRYREAGVRAWEGILKQFVTTGDDGLPSLNMTVDGTGLSNDDAAKEDPGSHDGSVAYYLSVRKVSNDPRGLGPFLLAAVEVESLPNLGLGTGKQVVVDAWFNRQFRQTPYSNSELYHYKWNDESEPGYWFLGQAFRRSGATLGTLEAAPTAENLSGAQIYIIASPDTKEKTPQPNYISDADAKQVAAWVAKGGELFLLANDAPNTDLAGVNRLGATFGLHFEEGTTHHVIGQNYDMGLIDAPANGDLFHRAHTLYMKDTTEITPQTSNAKPQLTDKQGIAIISVKYGKGMVLAVIDPWLYNEYTDGRRLPAKFDNFAAGEEVIHWLLAHAHNGKESTK